VQPATERVFRPSSRFVVVEARTRGGASGFPPHYERNEEGIWRMSIMWVALCLAGLSLALSTAILIIVWRLLRSDRRSERAGEERLEILREQQERLAFMREERQLLLEELQRQHPESEDLLRGKPPLQEEAGAGEQVVEQAAEGSAGRSEEPPEATLAAKRKAEELGVDIWRVEGSGANGRITVIDVLSAANRG
jgi:pyruvate/2-oxoglutarate dehydrogenase complex dihydrolipoamide acyltransferase (E2) component